MHNNSIFLEDLLFSHQIIVSTCLLTCSTNTEQEKLTSVRFDLLQALVQTELLGAQFPLKHMCPRKNMLRFLD